MLFNETGFEVAWLARKVRGPAYSGIFIVKGTFHIVPDGVLAMAPKQLPLGGEGPDVPNDFESFKPRTDLLVVGHAHSPGGTPVTTLPVSFQVGSYSKELGVVGDREKGSPEPFVRMKLAWERALKGPRNPAGREVPNLTAGAGPVPLAWRIGKAGTYDKAWLKKRWPWYPEDFDWSALNAAPEDQQVEGLAGDEAIVFRNLHPSRPVLTSRLPGIRVRLFYGPRHGSDFRLAEVAMRCDTLWAEPEAERLFLVWRGLLDLRGDRIPPEDPILVVTEPLDRPRSLEHYDRLLREKMREDAGADRDMIEEVREEPKPAPKAAAPPPGPTAEELAEDRAAAETLAQVEADLRKAGADGDLRAPIPKDPQAHYELMKRKFAAAGMEIPFPPPEEPAPPAKPAAEPAPPAPERHDRAWCAERHRRGESFRELDLTGVNLSRLNLEGADFSGAVLTGAILRKCRLAGANFTGAVLADAALAGADARKAVFEKADLGEVDFAGADLSGAILDGADASGARFEGAKLDGVSAAESLLTKANLNRASLRDARLPGADLSGCTLHHADATGANLAGATLDRAWSTAFVAERADLTGAGLNGASFPGGNFRSAKAADSSWSDAKLPGASFVDADLELAILSGAELAGADLSTANLKNALLVGANLHRARAIRTNLFQATLDKADLRRADFSEANLFNAGLFEARTEEASFERANVKRTLLTL